MVVKCGRLGNRPGAREVFEHGTVHVPRRRTLTREARCEDYTLAADLGSEPLSGSAADFAKLIAEETEKWGKVVKFASLKAD